eukprot:TRINITY_DN9740_c0_g1_i1.p1 TRINITY_DN9740_c0_g1~~TRINITY_DN9740_c0_g1_i1.p1  ORF type:complete len:390 (-),score=54.47 TRINITY_DN9740_c0_g1_i1:142-1311(-)
MLKSRLTNVVTEKRAKVTQKLTKIFDEKKETLLKLRDKLSFVFGVSNVASTGFVFGRYPHLMPLSFTIKFLLLVGFRLWTYRKKRWHYFLFDFCYFVNLLVIFYLHVLPGNHTLFAICWSLSNGPLAWSIIAWRNSMVFHSLDKMTSIFIHVSPPMVMYSLRWFHADSQFNICGQPGAVIEGIPTAGGSCELSFFDAFLLPFLPYIFWQVAYFVKVEVLSKHKVIERNYMTSFRWISADERGVVTTLGKKLNNMVGLSLDASKLIAFVALQFVYTILTLIPVWFFFSCFWLHTIFMASVLLVSVWNGANFYIDVFSKKYIQSIAESVTSSAAKATVAEIATSASESALMTAQKVTSAGDLAVLLQGANNDNNHVITSEGNNSNSDKKND